MTEERLSNNASEGTVAAGPRLTPARGAEGTQTGLQDNPMGFGLSVILLIGLRFVGIFLALAWRA